MSILLYPHNQIAYKTALQFMEETGKAAIVHPTGTGKSLIAFKLAEEHAEERICWLAPSEYIFRTQSENLEKLAAEEQAETARLLENITFLTYSKLMMDEKIIETLKPDYIILDEFHRCGASEWGRSVQKLLAAYPKAQLLGLSATSVRYLDNQRDMAEELFDGVVASEMTLGEAIAKEILPAPMYVVSMYSYGEELKRLQKRVAAVQNEGLRRVNEEILQKLKRSLENAQGLEAVFARHMKKDGKYIVFCADKEHMEEMAAKGREWFHLLDGEPHIYQVYYDNPKTAREFEAFKEDNSRHLKLLFCIDMLNEGVHVADVDGVVLLRPTVSPILYLQQIGRALAAGEKEQPVIFDIVNNFDSLCSIDSLRKEIDEAFFVMGDRGKAAKIHEKFRIIDEMRECRKLFEQLRRNLSAPWDIYYHEAKKYFEQHGNLKVPKNYVAENGLTLGSWILTQRRVYAGKVAGSLTAEQIIRLEQIGMDWQSQANRNFERGYKALAQYREQCGNTDVVVGYVTEDGFPLGKWVSNLRQKKKTDKEGDTLTAEQFAKLDALGMIWNRQEYSWEQNYKAAEWYYRSYGNLEVPYDYRTEGGLCLGTWLINQKRIFAGKKKGAAPLNPEKVKRLTDIGMMWEQDRRKCHNQSIL